MKITVSCEELYLDSIDALIERLQAIRAESPSAVLERDHDGLYVSVYRDATPEEVAEHEARWAKLKRQLTQEAEARLDSWIGLARPKEPGAPLDADT